MKGKQIKDAMSLAMIQLFTKLLDEDSIEANTIESGRESNSESYITDK